MSRVFHETNPAATVEAAYRRIERDRMAGLPILNPALAVQAVDFQRWQEHWLGVVISPWCMSLLLIPGSTENWVHAGQNQRRFVSLPAGNFAFLASEEEELGEFQSCSLFSPMDRFPNQTEAIMTAQAAMVGLFTRAQTEVDDDKKGDPPDVPSHSRRRFFTLR